jgi:hypothetical protein
MTKDSIPLMGVFRIDPIPCIFCHGDDNLLSGRDLFFVR